MWAVDQTKAYLRHRLRDRPGLTAYLADTLRQCQRACEDARIEFESELIEGDLIDDGVRAVRQEMFRPPRRFNCAILNPPYKKITSDSETRAMLREIAVETSNLYTGFLSVILVLLNGFRDGPSLS